MEVLSDLNSFAKILTDKGYNGHFHTQGAYPGTLRESISGYLESCRKDTGAEPVPFLLVTGYLQWDGEERPHVECSMWVKYLNGKFFLSKMALKKKDRYGQLLRQSELTDLTVATAPEVKEAIALVSVVPQQKIAPKSKLKTQ